MMKGNRNDIREFIKAELKDFEVPPGFCGGRFPLVFIRKHNFRKVEIEIRTPGDHIRHLYNDMAQNKDEKALLCFVEFELKNYREAIKNYTPMIYVHLRKNKSIGKIEVRRLDGRKYFLEMENNKNP